MVLKHDSYQEGGECVSTKLESQVSLTQSVSQSHVARERKGAAKGRG